MLKGCDMSHWNTDEQFDYISKFAEFFILKATESLAFRDATCKRRLEYLIRKGKRTGVYHFFRNVDAKKQVENFASIYETFKAFSVPVLDIEVKDTNWNIVRKFIQLFEERFKRDIILYVDNAHYKEMPKDILTTHKIWIARYNNNLSVNDIKCMYDNVVMWQFTDHGTFNGHSLGALDVNYFFGTGDDWNKL